MPEKKYIEREAAIAIIEEKQKELCPVGMYSRHAVYGSDREKFDAWEEIIEALEAIPAADVAPVVRCKECRHRDPEDHKCDSGGMERQGCPFKVADDYFCAYGER